MMERTLGRYALRRELGPAAVGTVWEAWDEALARVLALEIVRLAPGGADRAELVARFRHEAQVTGRLSKPGLVQVYDLGEAGDEVYIAREFCDGESLRQLIDRIVVAPVARAVDIMLVVLATLDQCHRIGIVHRDIRPQNILLPSGRSAALTGFDIAHAPGGEATLTGSSWRVTSYASPEQLTDQYPVDARSDVWSCGVVLYEMLAGRHPFEGHGTAMTTQAIVHDEPEPPSNLRPALPPALEDAILRALRKAPAERFPSAAALADALRTATAAAQESPVPPARRRLPLRDALVATCLLVLVAGVVAFWTGSRPESPRPDRPSSVAETSTPAAAPSPVQPEAVPAPSLAQRVRAIPCSTVSAAESESGAAVSLRGIVGSGAPRSAFDAIVAGLAPDRPRVAVREFPSTPTACGMAELVRAHAGSQPGYLILPGDGAPLRPGGDIRVRLQTPDFGGEVRLEDLDGDGNIQHVMEANLGVVPHFAAGTTIGLGQNGDDLIGRAANAPGTEILVAIMTSSPLFAQPRPSPETASAYLDALERALDAMERQGSAVSMDAVVLTTVPPGD